MGARLTVAPTMLRLTFSEAMEPSVSRFVLVAPDGHAVQLSAVRAGNSAKMLIADITGAMSPGRFTVQWRGAGRDGHPVHGEYTFDVDSSATGVVAPASRSDAAIVRERPTVAASTDTVTVTVALDTSGFFTRWLQLIALITLIGSVGFILLVSPAITRGDYPALAEHSTRRSRMIGLVAVLLLLVLAVVRLRAEMAAIQIPGGGKDISTRWMLQGTVWGHAWALEVIALVFASGGLLVPRARVPRWALLLPAVLLLAYSAASSGHAANDGGLAVLLDALHVLGAGGWLGTLLIVVIAGLPAALRAPEGERGTSTAALIGVFSPIALVCATAVIITGLGSAWLRLGGIEALWGSTYGGVLLIKLGVVSLLVVAGAYNWRRVTPSLAQEGGARRMRRSAIAELAIGALVLAVTAVLIATRTPV